jgi:hypothetical protein
MDGSDHLRVCEVSRSRQIEAQLETNAGGPLRQHHDAVGKLRRFLYIVSH